MVMAKMQEATTEAIWHGPPITVPFVVSGSNISLLYCGTTGAGRYTGGLVAQNFGVGEFRFRELPDSIRLSEGRRHGGEAMQTVPATLIVEW